MKTKELAQTRAGEHDGAIVPVKGLKEGVAIFHSIHGQINLGEAVLLEGRRGGRWPTKKEEEEKKKKKMETNLELLKEAFIATPQDKHVRKMEHIELGTVSVGEGGVAVAVGLKPKEEEISNSPSVLGETAGFTWKERGVWKIRSKTR